LRRLEEVQAIPFLLIDEAYLCKLFRQQYSSTSSTKQNNTSQTIADEIIKKPTYFRGSKDDVHD
ncbi:unnamed protein product, partial [Rotaria sordida]